MRVSIIGAGVIGAAVAEELASRGAAVTVLDIRSAVPRRHPGVGVPPHSLHRRPWPPGAAGLVRP